MWEYPALSWGVMQILPPELVAGEPTAAMEAAADVQAPVSWVRRMSADGRPVGRTERVARPRRSPIDPLRRHSTQVLQLSAFGLQIGHWETKTCEAADSHEQMSLSQLVCSLATMKSYRNERSCAPEWGEYDASSDCCRPIYPGAS